MLRQRALSALMFVPPFLALTWLGGIAFNLCLLVVLVFAGFEFARMLKSGGYRVSFLLMMGATVALGLLRMSATGWL